MRTTAVDAAPNRYRIEAAPNSYRIASLESSSLIACGGVVFGWSSILSLKQWCVTARLHSNADLTYTCEMDGFLIQSLWLDCNIRMARLQRANDCWPDTGH